MFLNIKPSKEAEALIPRIHELNQLLMDGFTPESEVLTFDNIDNLYELFDRDHLFLIQDGMLHMSNNGQIICSFDEGDIVGITHSFGYTYPILRTDEFVQIVPIKRDAFLQHIYADKRRTHHWSHFLLCQNAILSNQLASISHAQMRPIAGFQNVKAGDVIIQQGEVADHVYTFIEGGADVLVDGKKVAEIGKEEVFGAMAVFTGEPRSATVIANQASTVMAVPKEDFVLLIEAQPNAAVHLIENLARKIIALNQQLVEKV